MTLLHFHVLGLPKPQPRPRWSPKHRRIYTPDTAKNWKACVEWAVLGALNKNRVHFDGPTKVQLHFTMPDRRKADIDNLVKSTLDAIVNAGAMADDNLVVELLATKAVGTDTGCEVLLSRADDLAERARRNG